MDVTEIFVNGISHRQIWREVMPDHPEDVPDCLQFRVSFAMFLEKHFSVHYIRQGATEKEVLTSLEQLTTAGMSKHIATQFAKGVSS